MIEQKIVFGCNHIISALRRESVLHVVKRDAKDLTDRITSEAIITNVLYVYQLNSGPNSTVTYKKDVDYTVNNNDITWISAHRPADDGEYQCEVIQVRRTIQDFSANPEICERCYGQGWYVDVMSNGYQRVDSVTGLNKLVQDYVKVLYTKVQPDGYGTRLLNLSGESVIDGDIFLSEIGTEIDSAALQIQKIQANLLNGDSSALSDEEILVGVDILSMEYARDDSAAYVQIRLNSRAGSAATLSFKF